jgi:hypothetical protein
VTGRVTAISGIGDDAGLSTRNATIGWAIVIGTALAVFVGTLILKPDGKKAH